MLNRRTYYRQQKKRNDTAIRNRIKEIAHARVRYGYIRIYVLLRREGWHVNHKRVHRIYKEEYLSLRIKRPKRRVSAAQRMERPQISKIDQCWSMDFVVDQLFNGRRIRALTIVDNFSRECVGIEVAFALKGEDVVLALDKINCLTGRIPKYLRSDNGPEFVSKALLGWAAQESLHVALIEPGKPWQNRTNESFNGKFRDECLSAEWFRNRIEAKIVIEDWRVHYNEVRPHSGLNYQTPIEYKRSLGNYVATGANFSM